MSSLGKWCFAGVSKIWSAGLVLGLAAALAACGSSAPAPGACQTGEVDCGGVCVNLENNADHCGACGSACDGDQVCSAGQCTTTCDPGYDACDGACADLDSDPNHCGTCGNSCGSDQDCVDGACVLDCPSGYQVCNGACANLDNDRYNCGQCGTSCGSGQVCAGGACAYDCPAGQIACGGSCIDPDDDRDYCGARDDCTGDARGQACREDQVCSAGKCECPTGQVECGGACIDPDVNNDYCGAKNNCTGEDRGQQCNTATQTCTGGDCVCNDANLVNCDGTCIDPKTNPNYCGADDNCTDNAGEQCRDDQACYDEQCDCANTEHIECDDTCIDPKTDPNYCGAEADCTGDNAGETCADDQRCFNEVCYLDVTYAGALGPTTGQWNFGGELGVDGANTQCNDNWPGSRVCEVAELQAASDMGQLAEVTNVSSFWIFDPDANSRVQCDNWTYQTADINSSLIATLAGGVLDQVTQNNSCGAGGQQRHVACCIPPGN